MTTKKKKTKKTTVTTKHNAMWHAAFNSAIQGQLASTGTMEHYGDVELTEFAGSIVRHAEKIADIAAERLS